MNGISGISGYDFVKRIIAARHDTAIADILHSAGDGECDYLELKATLNVSEEHCHSGEKPADIYWNVARELIAMINTRGGLLVIGISNDPSHAVTARGQLDPEDIIATQGIEAFIRETINSKVVPQNQTWYAKRRCYTVDSSVNLDDYLEIEYLPYLDGNVIAYLVRPCKEGEFVSVHVTYADTRLPAPEELPRRHKGTIGECESLRTLPEMIKHIENRQVNDPQLATSLERILKSNASIALNTLPSQNKSFVGREQELKEIAELIDKGRIPILHGEGGTGKSELACEYAHRHKGRFAGGCLFVNMQNVSDWSTALNTIYANPKVRQALGPLPIGCEVNRSNWIFSHLIAGLERGSMLVILDNLDDDFALSYNELQNGPLANHLSGTSRVCIIATTRVVKHTSLNPARELASVIPLGHLDPTAAEQLLCANLPEDLLESDSDRQLVRDIARCLGHHAWRTEIAGSLLSQNYKDLVPPPLETYLKQLRNKSELALGQHGLTYRGKPISVADLLAPTIEQLKGHEGETGLRALNLAKAIAFFPVNGVTEPPLRRIWSETYKYPTDCAGVDEFRRALNRLEQYALIGRNRVEGRIRMHQLTQDFFRSTAPYGFAKDNERFADLISRTLANDPDCPGRYWAELAKEGLLMAHCPWKNLDGESHHDIVLSSAKFASKISWEKLDGYEVAEILEHCPDLVSYVKTLEVLYHDDSESPCCAFAILLAQHGDRFADKCDFSRLSCRDIVFILARQPHLISRCGPALARFRRKEWTALLAQQPLLLEKNAQFSDLCEWERLHCGDWVHLIASHPQYATDERFTSRYALKDLSLVKWSYLLAHQPDAFKNNPLCPRNAIAASARAATLILRRQPQLIGEEDPSGKRLFAWDLSKLEPVHWVTILSEQPGLAPHCKPDTFNRFSGENWASLMTAQPHFSGRCHFAKLDGNDWGKLLVRQPQLAQPKAWQLMADQPHDLFYSPLVRVLYHHPELAETQRRDLSSLSNSGKRLLLSRVPSLAEHQIPLSGLEPHEWARLVMAAPHFARNFNCPFKDINPVELAVITQMQPDLKSLIRQQVTSDNWSMAEKIGEDRIRILRLSDLFWHLDDARMSCNLQKTFIVSANLAWHYFVFGLAPQTKRYLTIMKKCLKKNVYAVKADSAYAVSDPFSIQQSLETMVDLFDTTTPPDTGFERPSSELALCCRHFPKSRLADTLISSLKTANRRHKTNLQLVDIDLSSKRDLKKIDALQADGRKLVCLNFEERLASNFTDERKRKAMQSYHDEKWLFDPRNPERIRFHAVLTVSPMTFREKQLPADAGDRLLRAVLSTSQPL